jgi:hypothetical protein
MFPRLNLPAKLPRWATDPNRTLEPDESYKDNGWADGVKPPARWKNWLENLAYQWVQRIGGIVAANWQVISATVTTQNLLSVIHHPTMEDGGLWMAIDDGEDAFKSVDGRTWSSAGVNILNALANSVVAIDNDNVIVGGVHSGSLALAYTSNKGVTWNVDTGIPETAQPDFAISKYPDSDLLIVGSSTSANVYIASGGVGTSWVAATTNPSSNLNSVVRAGASTFLGINGIGSVCSVSVDDGDTWADAAGSPSDVDLNDPSERAIACDRNTGTVAQGGRSTSPTTEAMIAFTRDLGATWTQSVIYGVAQTTDIKALYACGGGLWYASGVVSGVGSGAGFVSFDDAETFYPASFIGDYVAPSNVLGVASDGRMLLVIRNDKRVAHSLSVPG